MPLINFGEELEEDKEGEEYDDRDDDDKLLDEPPEDEWVET
jgi:hypothetical protein